MNEKDILKVETILLDRINLLESELVKYINQVQILNNSLAEKDKQIQELSSSKDSTSFAKKEAK